MTRFYVSETTSEGLRVRTLLNGWPVANESGGGHAMNQAKLNAWIVEGENTITVQAAPASAGGSVPEIFLQVFAMDSDARDRHELLLGYRWTQDTQPLTSSTLQTVFEHRMRIPKAFGRWAWEDAAPFQESDRDDVLALLARMQDAFARKDLDAVLELLAHKHEEMSHAIGSTKDKMAEQDATVLQEYYFKYDHFGLAPIEPEHIVLHPWAGGRLVTIENDDVTHPIIGLSDYQFAFDMTVSKIDGEWRITR